MALTPFRAALLTISLLVPTVVFSQGGPPAGSGQTIASLTSALTALDARVAKLESGQVEEADLAGSYAVFSLGIEMRGGSFPIQPLIGTETGVGTITLNVDGTGSFTGGVGRFNLNQGIPWTVTNASPAPEGFEFNWDLDNGVFVIPGEGDDESLVATLGAGGRVLIAGGSTGDEGENLSWSNILLMVRLPD